MLAQFKTEAEGDNKKSAEEESLTVQTSRGRQSVKRFTISNHRTIDPRRAQGSESSQIAERRQRYMAMLGMVK